MRPIDADKLKQDLLSRSFFPAIVAAAIKNAPTFNPYEWVSVEERLPNTSQDVLICVYNPVLRLPILKIDHYSDSDGWEVFNNTYSSDNWTVTHWMPLPVAPQQSPNYAFFP